MYSFKSFKNFKKAAAYKTILAFKNAAKATTIALRDLLRAYFRGFLKFFFQKFWNFDLKRAYVFQKTTLVSL